MRNITLLLLLFHFAFSTKAQSLKELIDKALQENYQIKLVKNNEKIASNNNSPGNAGFMPSVDVSGQYTKNVVTTEQQFFDAPPRTGSNAQSDNITASALVNWTVFNGFRVFAKREQLGNLEKIGTLESRYYIEQTVADIALLYYQLIFDNQLLENRKEALEVSRFRYLLELKKKSIGAGSALSLNQAQIDYQMDSAVVLAQEIEIKSLETELNRIVNRELEEAINPQMPAVNLQGLPDRDVLKNQALASNTDYNKALLQEMVEESNLMIQRADRYPEINLFAGYSYNNQVNQVGFLKSNLNYGPVIGVSVRFNLYNGGNETREIRNAKLTMENANLSKIDLQRRVEASIVNQYAQLQSMDLRLEIAENNVLLAKSNLEIARKQLETGTINGYDFRQSQITFLEAENTAANLVFARNVLFVSLNRLSGDLLKTLISEGN